MTYYINARNHFEAMLLAARKFNAGETPARFPLVDKNTWCVTFNGGQPEVARVQDLVGA
jgi:hypothetical protein